MGTYVVDLTCLKAEQKGAEREEKNKAKSQANINLLLTDNYQDQQMSGKKTNPIFFPQNLILSVKNGVLSMMYQKTLNIPNKANLEIDSDVRN